MQPTETEYKGNPILKIPVYVSKDGKEESLMFGLGKAKKIIEHYEAIKEFVKKHDKPKT